MLPREGLERGSSAQTVLCVVVSAINVKSKREDARDFAKAILSFSVSRPVPSGRFLLRVSDRLGEKAAAELCPARCRWRGGPAAQHTAIALSRLRTGFSSPRGSRVLGWPGSPGPPVPHNTDPASPPCPRAVRVACVESVSP